jgi:hypothetical protein
MAQVPTILVKSPHNPGGVLINESDFDPNVHTRFDELESDDEPDDDDASPVIGSRRKRRRT